MANTYTLIASYLGGGSSVSFSNISANYTDLVLKMSTRKNSLVGNLNLDIRFNSDTGTNYSRTQIDVNSTTITSDRTSAATSIALPRALQGYSATVPTYNSIEIYIPSYTANINKPISVVNVSEFNSTAWAAGLTAGLYRITSAVTSITLVHSTFASDSTFFLYGIKNS